MCLAILRRRLLPLNFCYKEFDSYDFGDADGYEPLLPIDTIESFQNPYIWRQSDVFTSARGTKNLFSGFSLNIGVFFFLSFNKNPRNRQLLCLLKFIAPIISDYDKTKTKTKTKTKQNKTKQITPSGNHLFP